MSKHVFYRLTVPETRFEELASELGQTALDQAMDRASHICGREKQKRQKLNEAEAVRLRLRLARLNERRETLLPVARFALPQDPHAADPRRLYHGFFAFVLAAAGVFFAHLTLTPFGLGWETWPLALAIGIVGAFLTDKSMEKFDSERFTRAVCVVALLASLSGVLILAAVRGDILALYLKSSLGAETMGAASAAEVFYSGAVLKLQLLMGLLAIAMELGAGMALAEMRKLSLYSSDHVQEARAELSAVEEQMTDLAGQVVFLENEPEVFEADFMRNFLMGLSDRMKKTDLTRLSLILALLLLAPRPPAWAAEPPSVVIAVDLSRSVATEGYDGRTEFTKNVEGARQVVLQLEAGTQITVLAITDQSFSRPYVLLRRTIPSERGPLQFYDRIAASRKEIATDLRRVSEGLQPRFLHTDVFGALFIASEVFRQTPQAPKVFILFSDMRHSTPELNIERPTRVRVREMLDLAEKKRLIAPLSGVAVYALGVHGAVKSVAYWESLREFWTEYFRRSGAMLKAFSSLRELPQLESPGVTGLEHR